MKRRILIVDDEALGNKCSRMIEILEKENIHYDIVLTMEEAYEKMFSTQENEYDGIILDRNFPKKQGEKSKGREGDQFLSILEEHNKEIPVLLNSTMQSVIRSELVVDCMFPWELNKLQCFLKR